MKGLMLSTFYASKKSMITYFIVSIFAAIVFAMINPMMTCFLPMMFLISPITDNFKNEKESIFLHYLLVERLTSIVTLDYMVSHYYLA